jgi:hypothetical protein
MSPTAADNLNPNANDEQIQGAVSDCIAQRQNENPNEPQEQSIAICYSEANKSTGGKVNTTSISKKRVKQTG